MTILNLVKAGYGSLKEMNRLSTEDFLDIVEFENISNDILRYLIDNPNRG